MMRFLSKLKRPRVLLILVICAAAAGFGSLALLSAMSAKPAFCAVCHNMQPEYDSCTHDGYLAKAHADMGVTCHDCHEPTLAQQMKEGWLFVTGNYENPMPKYGFKNELCLSCHDFEAVKRATAHYGKENPHDPVHLAGNENPQQGLPQYASQAVGEEMQRLPSRDLEALRELGTVSAERDNLSICRYKQK